jgi:hypothetical protein
VCVHGVINIGNVKIKDLVKALLVVEVCDSAVESPFSPHCLCQALCVCQSRQGPVTCEALEFKGLRGKGVGVGGMTKGTVVG